MAKPQKIFIPIPKIPNISTTSGQPPEASAAQMGHMLQNNQPTITPFTNRKKTYINFKLESELIDVDLILWIKFYDNNERTFKNISFPSSLSQMYFGKMPIRASLKHVWETYHKLLEVNFKDKFRVARIYRTKNRGADDFIVQYTGSGEVEYRSAGVRTTDIPLDFKSEKLLAYEKALETKMENFISQLKVKYASK